MADDAPTLEPVYFYTKKSPFSNFYPSTFEVHGHTFWTNEQFFMWVKATIMGDEVRAYLILQTKSPGSCKRLGRKVGSPHNAIWTDEMQLVSKVGAWDEEKWNTHRLKAMTIGLIHKFEQNEHLMEALMATGTRELVEASPKDRIWGVGRSADELRAGASRRGRNLLGRALMDVRSLYA